MTHLEEVFQYCKDVKSGKQISCIWVKKAVEKFIKEYKQQKDEGFPYFFDEPAFNEIIDFAESLFIPDIQKTLELFPFQKFIYANIWGWKFKDNPERRKIRQAYVEIARKNSKTTSIMFPMILYSFIKEHNSEQYFISATEKLAEKSFIDLSHIIKETPGLEDIECFSSAITLKNSRIAFYGADATSFDSVKPNFAVVDEYHSYLDSRAVSGMRYGTRAKLNGTVVIITSAGLNSNSVCYEENKKCKSILSGTLTDDSYWGIIFCIDEKDKWDDFSVIGKANPALNLILRPEILKSDLESAKISNTDKADYKAKTLGLWFNSSVSWIPIEAIFKNKDIETDYESLKTVPCYCGLDLSSVNDLTAFSLCWFYNGKYYFKHHAFIPESTLIERYRKENTNFIDWTKKGIVTVIPGNTVNYDFVFEVIKKEAEQFNIKEICYDPWQSNQIINRLEDELPQITTIEFNQSLKNFSGPTKNYEKQMLDGNIVENSPLMIWELGNCRIKPTPNGDYKILKEYKSSNQRIDNCVCSIMALERCSFNQTNTEKAYSLEDILNSF